jgi:hypothetical protein
LSSYDCRICSCAGYSSLHMQVELIPWKFLHSLKVLKFGLWRTMSVCYVTLSLTPSGVNLCEIVKAVHKTLETVEDRAYYLNIHIFVIRVSLIMAPVRQ